ncbi:pentatricopeptide repeat-containing protein [Iris pallida]|uniref:Pentatricopeptide repeat-containing protein n=1 Tax=Iris pallida TaxID=29817 RepID=A0AAX6DKC8_IRIPA|nr:pentatricopeptide repeat-containing protein [Iris pallida]
MMRAFAIRGDFDMVKRLHARVWSDSVGSISPSVKREAYELLMEAAVNCDQVDVARQILSNIISEEKEFTWTSRGGMVAVRIEAIYGCSSSLFGPYMLPQIQLDDPVEKYMTAFEEACPLPANLSLKKVAIRFLKDSVVPIIDDWGSCVGIVHSDDCNERSGGTERGGGGGYSMAGTGTGTFYRGGAGSGRDRHKALHTRNSMLCSQSNSGRSYQLKKRWLTWLFFNIQGNDKEILSTKTCIFSFEFELLFLLHLAEFH